MRMSVHHSKIVKVECEHTGGAVVGSMSLGGVVLPGHGILNLVDNS
jgi:hypothetical protein